MLNLSLIELKLIAKNRDIKGSESMSEDELLSVLKENERNFDKTRIEEIREKFNDSRHKFSKSKIIKIRKDFYEIENKKDLSASRIKEIKENLLELEKNLSKSKKYYDYDDYEYKGISNIRNLSNDKDFKPAVVLLITTMFNMRVWEVKKKIYQPKNFLIGSNHF